MDVLRARFAGWSAAVLTGAPELGMELGLRAYRTHALWNGSIECRLLRIEVGPQSEREQRFSELTPREHEVLDLLAEGLRNQDIAGRLSIAEKTVKHHISSILSKLQLNHRTEPALLASRLGLGRRNVPS
jgi:DNA-binding NarL/FixJ family response regulator